jgi:hypothetical protein
MTESGLYEEGFGHAGRNLDELNRPIYGKVVILKSGM